METFTPNAYLTGGPVPVTSAVKDPRMVSLPAGTKSIVIAAADGSGERVWRRTDTIRDIDGLELRVYAYAGAAEA